MVIEERDIIDGEVVIRISDKFVFFDNNKRRGLSKLIRLIESGKSTLMKYKSPNTEVDWSNLSSVKDYYNSFISWSTYISMGCEYKSEIIEVKDGIVEHNGEFYLPAPNYTPYGTKEDKRKVDDGLYNVKLYRKKNSWYSKTGIELNLFLPTSKIEKTKLSDITPNTDEIYAYTTGNLNISYEHSYIDGISNIRLKMNDISDFFYEYFIKKRWGDGVRYKLSEEELSKVLDYNLRKEVSDVLLKIDNQVEYDKYSLIDGYVKFTKRGTRMLFDVFLNKLKS